MLLSRKPNGTGRTSQPAQGDIAAAIGTNDSFESHVADTVTAGSGLKDTQRVLTLVEAAAGAIEWLQSQGVTFDHADGVLKLGREGGHRQARIVHPGGYATGASVTAPV